MGLQRVGQDWATDTFIFLDSWQECKLVKPQWKTIWNFLKKLKTELPCEDFAGSPVLRLCVSNAMGAGLIPGQGIRILHAAYHGQKKKKKKLPYEPDISSLGVYPKEMKTWYKEQICILKIIAAIVTITRIWKQPKCLSVDKDVCINYVYMYVCILHIYTMKYYSARRKKEIHRQNALWHKSQQNLFKYTSQNNGNKSKNKQVGPT